MLGFDKWHFRDRFPILFRSGWQNSGAKNAPRERIRLFTSPVRGEQEQDASRERSVLFGADSFTSPRAEEADKKEHVAGAFASSQ
jgi:hypothetical protein